MVPKDRSDVLRLMGKLRRITAVAAVEGWTLERHAQYEAVCRLVVATLSQYGRLVCGTSRGLPSGSNGVQLGPCVC